MADQLHFALDEPPEGIAIEDVSSAEDGLTIRLRADAEKVKPGLKGNLILDLLIDRPNAGKAKAAPGTVQVRLGALPAIPFEVVGGQ